MKKKRSQLTIVLAVLVVSLFVFSCYRSEEDEVPLSEESSEEIEESAESSIESEEKNDNHAGQVLFEKMTELDAQHAGTIGFVLLNKSTDERIEVNAEQVFTSASLYKLYVTYAVLTEIDEGHLGFDTVMDGQANATVDEYLTETITLSKNSTAIALADRVGWKDIEEFIQENGFTETTFNITVENGVADRGTLQTTPGNVADFFNRLMEGDLLSEESTAYFMELLADQELDYALNVGLTDEVQFAHKTGLLDSVSHDAGIITDSDGQEYVVVVMTDGWDEAYEEATPVFQETGHYIMEYLSAQSETNE